VFVSTVHREVRKINLLYCYRDYLIKLLLMSFVHIDPGDWERECCCYDILYSVHISYRLETAPCQYTKLGNFEILFCIY
jgi:hypothetical protein